MDRPLFRPEAVDAQRPRAWASAPSVLPPGLGVLAAAAVVAATLVGAWLALAPYTHRVDVAGWVQPEGGLIRLRPAEAGTVAERFVDEGAVVRRGDVLFVLSQERSLLAPDSQQRVQQTLEDRGRSLREAAVQQQALEQTTAAALRRRLDAFGVEQGRVDEESALQLQRLALAEQALARLESLQAQGFVSPAQVQAKAEEVLALRAQARALDRQRASLARDRAELDGELANLPMRTREALGRIARDLAEVGQAAAEQEPARRLLVRAPRDGRVAAVLADPGQSVSAGGVLATVVPHEAALQVHLFAPSRAIGFVEPGKVVRVRLDAYPHARFGHRVGRVLAVSRVPIPPSELASAGPSMPLADAGEALYRVTVALDASPADDAERPLVAGMRVQASVLLDRRSVGSWLLEPVLRFRDRV
jgi:membrane fusion protein